MPHPTRIFKTPEELLNEKSSLDFLQGAKRIRVIIMMEEYAKQYHEQQVEKDLIEIFGETCDPSIHNIAIGINGNGRCGKCGSDKIKELK
jgi:hypothetical protein